MSARSRHNHALNATRRDRYNTEKLNTKKTGYLFYRNFAKLYCISLILLQYEKLVMTNDMIMKKEEFVLQGRKVPLTEIREKTLLEHAPYSRDKPDTHYANMTHEQVVARLREINEYKENDNLNTEQLRQKLKSVQRHRHLLIWHDNSTVANHGYLLCLVSVLYDPAVHLTNEEYKAKTGKTISVQKIVEKPHLHFIARCGSSEAEQLAYSETRLTCIKEMTTNLITHNGSEFIDTARFFHGDNPAREVEAGQQKGGHYFCSNCGCHAERVNELDHALNCPIISFQNRIDAVMKLGTVSRANSIKQKLKPLSSLSKKELEKELGARGIYDGNTKQELQAKLDMELHGIQRVPALLVNVPDVSLDDLHLADYEILPTEPLHDIGHHIENVLAELPHHLAEKEKQVFEKCVSTCLDGKDSKRGFDYRVALLKTTAYAQQNKSLSETPLLILETLSEMQQILYCEEEKRSPCLILRYYNQSWYHAILLKLLLKHPKKLTKRKLFGAYFHDLTAHAGCMLRLVSGQAANAEEEERMFHHIKQITKRTSNYSDDQVIPNIMVRLQAEKQMTQREDVSKQDAHISTLSKALNRRRNTRIPISTVKKFEREWQAHLQEISDFLLKGEGVWWHKDDEEVEFHDVSCFPEPSSGPQLHHFRSSNLQDEKAYLQQCWCDCVEQKTVIPTHIIRVDQPDGRVKKIHTPFLSSSEHSPIPQDSETVASSITPSPIHSTTASRLPDKEELSESEKIVVEAPEHVVDIQLVPEEVLELGDLQGSKTTSDSLDQVPITKKTKPYVPQSSLCKALAAVLGPSDKVLEFDKLHRKLKATPRCRTAIDDERKYMRKLASFQKLVLAESSATKQALQKWEKDYLLQNNLKEASYEFMKTDPVASIHLKKIKYSDALFKQWNMK